MYKSIFQFSIAIMATTLLASGVVHAGTAPATTQPAATQTGSQSVQIQRVEVAPSIYELAYSEKHHAVFVVAPGWEEGAAHKLLRLHPQTLALQAEVVLPFQGFGIALDEAAGRVYVGHGFDAAVSVVDVTTNTLIKTIQLAAKVKDDKGRERAEYHVRELALDSQHKRLYLPGLAAKGSVLFVVDAESLQLENTIPGFGYQATGIALDAEGQRLYVSNQQGQVMEVDTATQTIVRTHEVEADQLLNLVFDAKTRRLFGTDQGINFRSPMRNESLGENYTLRSEGHLLAVIDTAEGKVIASPDTDKYPVALLLDSERKRLYVTNRNGIVVDEGRGTLMAFDSDSYQLLQVIPLLPHPNSLAFDVKNNVLYVSVKNDRNSNQAGRLESVVRIQF